MPNPRNQHWIPQFYMRGFAASGYRKAKNAKVWTMDVASGLTDKQKVRELGACEHLYSHIKADGTHCYQVEKKLAKLESIIARLYPRVAEGVPDLSEAWGIKKFVAVFIASLILRHPQEELRVRAFHRTIVDLIEPIPKDSNGQPKIDQIHVRGEVFPFDASSYDEYKAADENRLKQAFAEQIHPLAVQLSENLFSKRWCFLCADTPVFLSSDSPVVKQHTERANFGIGTAGVHIWFPISPYRMLWMMDRQPGEVDGFYPFPVTEAAGLNMFVLNHASRFILSHQDPDIPLSEIRALIDSQRELFLG